MDLDSIKSHISIQLTDEDLSLIKEADAGSAEAQNDLFLLLMERGKPKSALYWLELAVKQDYPDAMHWLGRCYIEGNGVPQNEDMGIMWLAKAAAHGHVISKEQLEIMKGRFR